MLNGLITLQDDHPKTCRIANPLISGEIQSLDMRGSCCGRFEHVILPYVIRVHDKMLAITHQRGKTLWSGRHDRACEGK